MGRKSDTGSRQATRIIRQMLFMHQITLFIYPRVFEKSNAFTRRRRTMSHLLRCACDSNCYKQSYNVCLQDRLVAIEAGLY